MTTLEEGMKKASLISEALEGSDIPKEAKALAMMGSIMGASNDSIIKGLISQTDQATTKADKTPLLRKPKDYSKTQSILHDMLTENTGIQMMDSGGDNGRAWQRNRRIADFRLLDPVKVELFGTFHKGEMPDMSKNLFHYLDANLTYSAAMTAKFKRFCNKPKNKEESYMGLVEEWAESLESDYPISTQNSYNNETCLSGDIQYTIFSTNDLEYCILQVHGGADIRGGYTDPKVFEFNEGSDVFVMAQSELNASCDCLRCSSFDSGYHWEESDNKNEFPKIWHWSERLQGVYCQECRKNVNFS